MSNSKDLKDIFAAGRPLVEQWLDVAEEFAALGAAAREKGLDWGQIKSLLKAQVQDEREGGDGKRVRKIVEKADYASSYADMLGLGDMNKNIFSAPSPTIGTDAVPPCVHVVPPPDPFDIGDIPASLRRAPAEVSA